MENKRLIDANAIYDAVERRYRVSSGIEHRCERDLLDLICSAETVDAVEVVRCKDCKYYNQLEKGCDWHGYYYHVRVEPDGFCSYGEKREV